MARVWWCLGAAVIAMSSEQLLAQGTSLSAAAASCTYQRCALGIAPAWNGLVVTRGAAQERVANLGFFWTRSLDHVFVGSDSALAQGRRAVRVRRVAAVLTDVGALTLGYAAVRAVSRGSLTHAERVVSIAGGAAFAASVPLQFAADGLLSRAVWWRNAEYSGR